VAFHAPRPYWYSKDVKALSAEGTFGLPSGHAQRAVVLFGALAAWLKRGWAWAAAIALILLVGLSRLYLESISRPTRYWVVDRAAWCGAAARRTQAGRLVPQQALSAQILLSFLAH